MALRLEGAVMKLCILGAAGNAGRRLVSSAIEKNHAVTALVRKEGVLPSHSGLTVRAVTFEDAEQLAEAMHGHDAVINAAGNLSCGFRRRSATHSDMRSATDSDFGSAADSDLSSATPSG
jgi:putative NADH-flavin reductase